MNRANNGKVTSPAPRESNAKKVKPASAIDAFIALPDEEKERIVAEFDKPFQFEKTRPLTPAQRRMWEAARKAGRPRRGKGAKAVSVTIERGLLQRADAFAKAKGMSRSQLIAAGLDEILGRLAAPAAGR